MMLSHQETPGLGDKADKKKSNWSDQFNNKNPEKEKKFFQQKTKLRVFIIAVAALVLIQIIYVIVITSYSIHYTKLYENHPHQVRIRYS